MIGNEPRLGERIDVHSLDALSRRLYKAHRGSATLVCRDDLREMLRQAGDAEGDHGFTLPFLQADWKQVVDAWPSEPTPA